MGPQSKKRKLQPGSSNSTGATNNSKRQKHQQPPNKTHKNTDLNGLTPKANSKTKPHLPRRDKKIVEAASLAWSTVDVDEFGGLEVIEGVDVVKHGDKVQFVLAGDKKQTKDTTEKEDTQEEPEQEKEQDAEDEFEGFGDDALESKDVPPHQNSLGKDGLALPLSEDQAPDEKAKTKASTKKQKQQKADQQQHVDDAKLVSSNGKKTHQASGNSFEALAGDAVDDDGDDDDIEDIDVAAWAALNLSPRILSAIAKLKFSTPTDIQAQTIPEILNGEDVIGKAQTGSGKTLAFGIPIVERWLDIVDEDGKNENKEGPLALVLSPTRELAKQLGDHLKALCDGLPTAPWICVITGGLSIQKQRRQLEKADIIIGTPGRLWEVLEGDAKIQEAFTKIQFLVVDEADRLFKAGQFKEAEHIIGALDRKDPEAPSDDEDEESDEDEDEELSPRQTLVFSATFDKELQTKLAGSGKRRFKGIDTEDKMAYLMKCLQFRQEPKFIDVNPTKQMAEGLKEGLIECGPMEKDLYLYTVLLLNPKRRTLVFANSISAVRRLTPFLQNLGIDAMALHSQMPQKARLRSLERFTAAANAAKASKPASSNTNSTVLVATDVAARGLDIPQVDMVIHYHVPRAADAYVHRSGRTARGGRTGASVLLCAPDEVIATRRLAGKIHSRSKIKSGLTKKDHVIQTLPVDRHIVTRLKPRADLAKRIADAILAKEKTRSDESFMRTTAEELGVEYDSDDDAEAGKRWNGGRGGGRKRKEKEASAMTKAEMGAMKAKLREELARRVNLGVSERYITGGRVDVAAILREREKGGGTAGLFLGGDALGLSLGFE